MAYSTKNQRDIMELIQSARNTLNRTMDSNWDADPERSKRDVLDDLDKALSKLKEAYNWIRE